jgi:phosphatidate cytidylyltransferase
MSKAKLSPVKDAASAPLLSPLKSPHRKPVAPIAQPAAIELEKKKGANEFVNRLVFSLLMCYGFLGLIAAGAGVCIPLVLFILVMMFREVLRINQKERKDRQLPYFRFLPWWFLWVTVTLMTLVTLRDQILATYPQGARVVYNHIGMTAFGLYVIGLVAFVLSLKKGMYRYQFHQFTWMAMTLFFIVLQGSFQVSNMLYGMVWFLLPLSCVVNNDIWAYAFGKSFGRTRLLALSPKKTVEGFLGAWLFTMIFAFWFAGFLSRFPPLVCPKLDFNSALPTCEVDPLFVSEDVVLPAWVATLTFDYWKSVSVCPVQYHALAFGVFASLIAPFGGFFASGLKRAFKLKDFGDLIPGHGGMTDRMDCQIIMGLFTAVYLRNVVFTGDGASTCPTVAQLVQCVAALSESQRAEVMKALSSS